MNVTYSQMDQDGTTDAYEHLRKGSSFLQNPKDKFAFHVLVLFPEAPLQGWDLPVEDSKLFVL